MLLKEGDNNDNVKKLQIKLGLVADGAFGPMTESKIKQWQAANSLTADGIVGDETWNKMFGITSDTTPAAAAVLISSSAFKLNNLKGHIPDEVIAQIPDTAVKFNITTPLRLAHFLAQSGHESAGFTAVQENLNYSSKGLQGTFKKYFPTSVLAEQYARQPQKIASRVYGSRMGNGPEATGDGYRYRGRGYIQLTGKANYMAFDKFVPEDTINNPDLVATKYPMASAAWFFDVNKLWSICDKGADNATIIAVTKRVNGGTNGLDDRIQHFQQYYNLLK